MIVVINRDNSYTKSVEFDMDFVKDKEYKLDLVNLFNKNYLYSGKKYVLKDIKNELETMKRDGIKVK